MEQNEFRLFFDKWYALAMYSANSFIRNHEQSQEIVADSFLSVWNNIHKLSNENKQVGWLMSCVKNKCINFCRLVRPKQVAIDDYDISQNFDHCEITAKVIALLTERVRNQIDHMPPQAKKIMHLVVDGKTNREIGGILGLSEKTIWVVKNMYYGKLKAMVIK